ncbi:MAG: cation diffusion facilitator family transporter [Candidatus Nitrosocosmicus sp.]|nr:cation diffusion facilitator family transporter [Candidatus Nitrosocosmicus sp.]
MSKYLAFEEGKKAAWLSIWTLLGIGVAEVVTSTTTGSLTLVADGLDSLADSLVSFIVWFGIAMIQKPKSKLFHYGYGKIESFAAFIAAIIVIILGIFIAYHAYERILHPIEFINPEITMITLLAAGAISLHRAFRVRSIAKKYNLISLNLDAKNSIKDGSASFVGFGNVLAGYFGIPYMDAVVGLIIAGYIFFMAYVALRESTLVLLDAINNPNLSTEIIKYVHEKFQLYSSNVRIRPLGHSIEAQVYVKIDPALTLGNTLQITEEIKKSISEKFSIKEVIVVPVVPSSEFEVSVISQ